MMMESASNHLQRESVWIRSREGPLESEQEAYISHSTLSLFDFPSSWIKIDNGYSSLFQYPSATGLVRT